MFTVQNKYEKREAKKEPKRKKIKGKIHDSQS